jgi:hypothetical protein
LKRAELRQHAAQAHLSLLPLGQLSFAPGFSRVVLAVEAGNGFNRFPTSVEAKPLKRLGGGGVVNTGLKPGANERLQKSEGAHVACRANSAGEFMS